ncbi:hypothetical protein HN873_071326, partial [Arachis hypogaea]
MNEISKKKLATTNRGHRSSNDNNMVVELDNNRAEAIAGFLECCLVYEKIRSDKLRRGLTYLAVATRNSAHRKTTFYNKNNKVNNC